MWPEVEPWLARTFRRYGVDEADVEDLCQIMALRLLTSPGRFTSARYFYRWLQIVAYRLVPDEDLGRADPSERALPEPAAPDPAARVEARALLQATVAELGNGSEDDRGLLVAAARGDDRGATQPERDRFSLRLHRARRRLQARLRGWWAGLPWWPGRFLEPGQVTFLPHAVVAVMLTVAVAAAAAWPSPSDATAAVVGDEDLVVVEPIVVELVSAVDVGGAAKAEPPRSRPGTPTPSAPGPVAEEPGRRVSLVPPGDAPGRTEAEIRPRRAGEDALACWGHLPLLANGCLDHPLR